MESMRSAYVLLLAATLSTTSFANQVYVSLTGMDSNTSTKIDLRVLDPGTDQYTTWTNVWAGGILTIAGNSAVEDYYCVDLFHDINVPGTYLDNVSLPNAALRQDRVAWMIDNLTTTFSKDSSISKLQGAGLQLAIWDIVTDGGDGFSTGSVQKAATTNADVVAWAQQYIALSVGKSAMDVGVYQVSTLNKKGVPYQTLMGDTTVPEPASLGFAAFGILTLALFHRRRSANSSRNTVPQRVPSQLS